MVDLAPAGQLTQFNMNAWNLGGNFPVDQLARFRALSEIDISNNPNMRADLKKMFDAFAQLQNLQVPRVVLSWVPQASAGLHDGVPATTAPQRAASGAWNRQVEVLRPLQAFPLIALMKLQVVELTGNAGMSGTFGYEATPENNQNTALCKTVQGGLRILNMNGLGLAGLALPDCLMGKTSTLEELRLGTAPH